MSAHIQREAAEIREEWLGRLLSTSPADRPAAEAAISGLYRLIGLPPPRFHWAASPVTALMTVPPGVRLRPYETVDRMFEWQLPPRLSSLMRVLCLDLDHQVRWFRRSMGEWIRREVRTSLERSAHSLSMPLRAVHDWSSRTDLWYATQGVAWVAHYDTLRRAAGVVFTPEHTWQLDLWVTLSRSCGWWWPRRDLCVVAERPVAIHTEVSGDNGEVRLHRGDGPALRYADGWEVHAWHGTQVPSWVITDPSVDRIMREANIEVRRCAIERIGWDSYIEEAGLRLVASVADPGNPGSELHLYHFRPETKVLLVVNGSVERDGRRRRYGLTVPGYLDDPMEAAAWTYGLPAEQYSLLARRT
ncbi:DUF6745 domain-containing protein [Rhizohabitans arisaemae]|uniref:DUF6745 domain-containing protein n=1 Tax=Rhizohabitans arisaemae TaxID=2720610 RepID=UPI0024B249CC|nr:hypothetical protein [Rhizohabitans arisaemae]